MPLSTFISVLLPAPFSPTSAWISPLSTWRLTLSRAFTPGKVFVMFFISSMISAMVFLRSPFLSGTRIPETMQAGFPACII